MQIRAVRVAGAVVALSLLVACSSTTRQGPSTTSTAMSATAAAQPAASQPAPQPAAPQPVTAQPVTATPTTPTPAPRPPNPCATNTAAQLVKVSIRAQHLWMCARHTLVRGTPVTTGIPGEDTHTPTGTYRVQGRTRNTTLTLISGQTYAVKYWIPFDGPLFGFHDASWQTFAYGSAKYKIDGSHGCVHMPAEAIAFLYRWVSVGTTVRIRA